MTTAAKEYSREERINLMVSLFGVMHDEFTAIRHANAFLDEFEESASQSMDKAEFVSRVLKSFGSRIGIDEVEIKRRQYELTRLLRGK